MVASLLSALPLLSVLAAFVYAAISGARLYRTNGFVSVLGVAATLAALTLGRLIDRLAPLPTAWDDWVNYRGPVDFQISTKGERFLAVLSVEVALLFFFAAAICVLAVVLIKRDATGKARSGSLSRQFGPIALLCVFAVGLTTRSKLAIGLAYLLAKAHLL